MNLLNALCFLPDGTLDRRDVEIEGERSGFIPREL